MPLTDTLLLPVAALELLALELAQGEAEPLPRLLVGLAEVHLLLLALVVGLPVGLPVALAHRLALRVPVLQALTLSLLLGLRDWLGEAVLENEAWELVLALAQLLRAALREPS